MNPGTRIYEPLSGLSGVSNKGTPSILIPTNRRHIMNKVFCSATVQVGGVATPTKNPVDIIDKVYEVGRKCAKGFKENMKIIFDGFLPKWNYRAIPAAT